MGNLQPQNYCLAVITFAPRSSYATNRLRHGYTLADIRDQMGHRDIHPVEHYLEAMRSE
jgi:hypothetical protein